MGKILHHLLAIVTAIIIVFSSIFAILLIFGQRPFVLRSGSMEPLYTRGSLVWIDTNIALSEIRQGNVIAYRAPTGNIIMHRLIAVDHSKPSSEGGKSNNNHKVTAILRGDANQTQDTVELTADNFIGRETFSLPQIGRMMDALAFSQYHWILWILSGALLITAFLPRKRQL